MTQNGPCDAFASSSSLSRSRWNTKCKRDAAAPPIWLRRVLNDATNVDSGSQGNVVDHLSGQEHDSGDRQQRDYRPARDDNRDRPHWQQPPAQGIQSEDASDLYLNPLAFVNSEDSSQHSLQRSAVPCVSHEGGSYASIHAAVAGGRTVQSARRTRVKLPALIITSPSLFPAHQYF
jgi:hypothetical protein